MSHFEVLVFRSQRTIHELTQSVTKHKPFRAVSCHLVDIAFGLKKPLSDFRLSPCVNGDPHDEKQRQSGNYPAVARGGRGVVHLDLVRSRG